MAVGAVGSGRESAVIDLGPRPGGGRPVAALAALRGRDVVGRFACGCTAIVATRTIAAHRHIDV